MLLQFCELFSYFQNKRQMVSIVDKLQETFGDNASEKFKTVEINSLQILHFKFTELQRGKVYIWSFFKSTLQLLNTFICII